MRRRALLLACVSVAGAQTLLAGTAGAAAPMHGPLRSGVPVEHATRTALPSDTLDVRIAMTENDTSKIIVSAAGGVDAPGATGARAVMFTPGTSGAWTVSTATSCAGPWTAVGGSAVATPVAQPATPGALLTLCADNGTQLVVQGTVKGVYNSNGQARTVNTLPLEEYVADVVTGESISDWGYVGGAGPQGHTWGFQELEAQAVAVRSYVLANPGGYGGYATTCDLTCQTYRGTNDATTLGRAATQDTAGQVMVMPTGSVATTEYSASTGGYTASSAEGSPFTPVPDTGDAVCVTASNPGLCNTSHRWHDVVKLTTIQAHWPAEGATPTVTVSARNGYGTWGGRATALEISGSGTSQSVPAGTFVAALGLKSNDFTITATSTAPTAIQITGGGWGHGIGMGQWGAFGYAIGTDNGQGKWTWQQIVDHYYAPATIASLPGSPATTAFSFTRVFGQTADATAAQELEHQFTAAAGHCPGGASTRPVLLATDADYPDALASAALARSLGTGTLLTPTSTLSSATATALRTEGVTRVYVVGGDLAVATSVVAALRAMPASACGGGTGNGQKLQVTRVSGTTEYDTAAALAKAAAARDGVGSADLAGAYSGSGPTGGPGRFNASAGAASAAPWGPGSLTTAIVATGKGFQDAEAGSTLSYAERFPILLTTPQTLSSQVISSLATLKIHQVVLLGGPLAIGDGVVAALEQHGVSVLRVAGSDATGTAVELARLETASATTGLGWAGTGSITVARGDAFSDGLAGAVVAADGPSSNGPEPLLLTESPGTVGSALAGYLAQLGATGIGGVPVHRLTVLGGPLAVTTAAVQQMGKDL